MLPSHVLLLFLCVNQLMPRFNIYSRFGKRALDVIISISILVLFFPLFTLLSVAVALFLGRPVIFRQSRPGLHGKVFTLCKFRTMNNACDPDGKLLPDAQRLTRLGLVFFMVRV